MSRIAVIGSGIAGLGTAWLLARRYDVLVLERDSRLGGHTHTHHIDTPDGPLALDTGFLVHNDRTYPRLIRLFDELGVACLDSDMSFGVTCRKPDFEYSTRDVNGLFAQRSNLLRPGHYVLLAEIARFNAATRKLVRATDFAGLKTGDSDSHPASRSDSHSAGGSGNHPTSGRDNHPAGGSDVRNAGAVAGLSERPVFRPAEPADLTLDEFFRLHRFSGELVDRFVLPLASAIWSASVTTIRRFPALTLARFFDQHGMNTLVDHPTWRVVASGSATYIPKLVDSPRITTWTNAAAMSVRRGQDSVEIAFADRPPISVDHVVFACHGDEVLPLLADASDVERDVLSAFRTVPNEAVLHTDASWLPRRPAARASWNYLIGDRGEAATVTYHLNRLQRLTARAEYCVTLNPAAPIEPYHLLKRMAYTHPLYTVDAVRAQARWADISGHRRTHFCGAYWFYGFHEDGLRSAVCVAEALGVRW